MKKEFIPSKKIRNIPGIRFTALHLLALKPNQLELFDSSLFTVPKIKRSKKQNNPI